MTQVYEIDGNSFSTLHEFMDIVWPLLTGYANVGNSNLDAFNDVLSWPEGLYVLKWKNSTISRERLGHNEIAKKLEDMLHTCHQANREEIAKRLAAAKRHEGPTMFDWLVEIIKENPQYLILELA